MDIEWKNLRTELPEEVQKRLDTRREARRTDKTENKEEKPLVGK